MLLQICSLSGFLAKVYEVPLLFVVFVAAVFWMVIYYHNGQTRKLRHIPSVGSDLPLLSYLGTFRFLINTTDIINKGVNKWPGTVFKVPDLLEWVVVVNGSKQIEELGKAPDSLLSSAHAITEAIQPDYTIGRNSIENPYHIPIIRSQLTRGLPLIVPDLHDEVVMACNEFIPITEGWQSVRSMDAVMKISCRASNRIFVGLPLCRDPDFVALNVQFTIDVVKTALILRLVPRFLKPLVNSLIAVIPKRIENSLRLLAPIIHARRQEREREGYEKRFDFLTWLIDEAKGEEATDRNLVRRLLTVNFGAIHSSATTFMHALYYLATFPEYIQPLREEVEEVVKTEGWTKTGLDQMHKIDSFIKESQRLHPMVNLLVGRIAVNDFTFSDGTVIPRGTPITVSVDKAHLNEKVYDEPMKFDGFRFSKMKKGSEKQVGMVSSSPDHLSFGQGRHLCPGRYFAACELKLMLAHMVMTYDVKLEVEGVRPPDMRFVTLCIPNPNANRGIQSKRIGRFETPDAKILKSPTMHLNEIN